MDNITNQIIELTENVVGLEKLYNQTLSNLNANITQFWIIFFGFLGIVGVGLVFVAKNMLETGMEKGFIEIQKEYDRKLKEQQQRIESNEIKSGSNSNGSYVKFPDGTQICTHKLYLSYFDNKSLANQWVFPSLFVKVENISISLIGDTISEPHKRILIQGKSNNSMVKVIINEGLGSNFKPDETCEVSLFAIGKWK